MAKKPISLSPYKINKGRYTKQFISQCITDQLNFQKWNGISDSDKSSSITNDFLTRSSFERLRRQLTYGISYVGFFGAGLIYNKNATDTNSAYSLIAFNPINYAGMQSFGTEVWGTQDDPMIFDSFYPIVKIIRYGYDQELSQWWYQYYTIAESSFYNPNNISNGVSKPIKEAIDLLRTGKGQTILNPLEKVYFPPNVIECPAMLFRNGESFRPDWERVGKEIYELLDYLSNSLHTSYEFNKTLLNNLGTRSGTTNAEQLTEQIMQGKRIIQASAVASDPTTTTTPIPIVKDEISATLVMESAIIEYIYKYTFQTRDMNSSGSNKINQDHVKLDEASVRHTQNKIQMFEEQLNQFFNLIVGKYAFVKIQKYNITISMDTITANKVVASDPIAVANIQSESSITSSTIRAQSAILAQQARTKEVPANIQTNLKSPIVINGEIPLPTTSVAQQNTVVPNSSTENTLQNPQGDPSKLKPKITSKNKF